MPNIKSAKKRVLVIQKKTLINQMHKTALKTAIKKFDTAVENKNAAEAKTLFNEATRKLDQAVKQGILHKNNAARKKSQLALKLAKIDA
ncbi:MAG: 30S ribosomal protein S20 [Firmicutes bacterium]|nr:30S ribosomal protein S20 [Bacillota bacterium]